MFEFVIHGAHVALMLLDVSSWAHDFMHNWSSLHVLLDREER